MTPRPRLLPSGIRRIAIPALAVATLLLAIASQGCGSGGSSEPEREPTSGSSPSAPEHPATTAKPTARKPAAAQPDGRGKKAVEHRKRPHGTASSPQAKTPRSHPKHVAANGSGEGDITCPSSYTRYQCAADAKAAAGKTPSYAASGPRDCLRAMSKAECQRLLEAQLAAQEAGGESFRPEDCLDHHTREECEAIFEAMGQAPK